VSKKYIDMPYWPCKEKNDASVIFIFGQIDGKIAFRRISKGFRIAKQLKKVETALNSHRRRGAADDGTCM
jgi:hypothetical protein